MGVDKDTRPLDLPVAISNNDQDALIKSVTEELTDKGFVIAQMDK